MIGTIQSRTAVLLVLATALVVMPAMGYVLYSGEVWPFSGDHDGVVTEEWCEEHDGELTNHNVIGHHGGLHCHLNNGSTYHVRAEGSATFDLKMQTALRNSTTWGQS